MFEIKGKYTTAKVMIDEVEESCVSQINLFTNHPAFTNPVAIMPDTHQGKGSVIGFTMELPDKIIPNVVGVDGSCAMHSFNIGKTLPLSLEELDRKIRLQVPFGAEVHEEPALDMKNDFPWKKANSLAQKFAVAYQEKFAMRMDLPNYSFDWFQAKCKKIGGDLRRVINSLGTLGGSNHFIETGIDGNGDYWVTIHSGSRKFGLAICEYWQNIAHKRVKIDKREEHKRKIQEAKETFTGKDLFNRIKELKAEGKPGINMTGLEWLEGEDAIGYYFDMIFTHVYAATNRGYIAKIIQGILKVEPQDTIDTVHNFIDFEDFIIRKGAIRSYEGERMLIPFNMRDGILICEGKSNPEWNYSAPHGAGRVLSRAGAKAKLDLDKFKDQMKGVYSSSVGQVTLDEAPDAYKDPWVIEQAIGPTAKVIGRIKPVHNMHDRADSEPFWMVAKREKKARRLNDQ